jgi:hypothetical protein
VADAIRFNQAAFKHGVAKVDIEWAVLHSIRDGLMVEHENKHLLIGFDTHGNLLEIMYNMY